MNSEKFTVNGFLEPLKGFLENMRKLEEFKSLNANREAVKDRNNKQ